MMDLLEVALPASASPSSPSSTIVLSTISSDGKVNLYDLARLPPASTAASKGKGKKAATPAATEAKEVEPIASYDTDKTRLTCVCAIGLVERKKGADGKPVEDEESSDEGDDDDDEEGDETEDAELSAGEEDDEAEFEGFEDEEEGEEE